MANIFNGFKLQTLQGPTLDPATLAGRVVLVSTPPALLVLPRSSKDCRPCTRSLPIAVW